MKHVILLLLLLAVSQGLRAQNYFQITNRSNCTVRVVAHNESAAGTCAGPGTTTVVPNLLTPLCLPAGPGIWYEAFCYDEGEFSCPGGQTPAPSIVGYPLGCGFPATNTLTITSNCNTCPAGTVVSLTWGIGSAVSCGPAGVGPGQTLEIN